ncbi:non-ribosomal peptide synthetase [Actinomadura terrae]|uniref:non-ribosomal peptide synthetase n=1 Tax=Actinomadura terrae TaxID=604353 RepID=UPI001FA7626F|nr:non-ribosomal peptide synthetase [Actinomadura terrae]
MIPRLEDLLDRHAERTPDAPAVDGGARTATFAEVARRSSAIAAALQREDLPAESVVALDLPAGPDLVAAMVGVLRAGLAFLPLNREAPATRRHDLLRRAAARVVIDTGLLEEIDPDASHRRVDHPPGRLAYVIFTSGSTGEPKGVMVERGSLDAMLAAHEPMGLRPGDRYLVFAPPHFDGFLVDTFVPLAAGACAVMLPRHDIMPGPDLAATLTARAITFATLPPAALALLPRRPYPALRGILTAGDRIPAALAAEWSARVEAFHNSYGPTEATVAATFGTYEPGMPQNHVGAPLPGVRVHIVDDRGEPVADGRPGEILIGGPGVARGYLDDPPLTAARFVPDPFGAEPGARLYRSGDLGSWRPDGTIAFHGRCDDELKVRGVRIHPAEIETVLLGTGELREAAVVAAGEGADVRLVAFAVPHDEAAADGGTADRLRRAIGDALPRAYLPQEIRFADALPIASTGKVDRIELARQAALRDRLPAREDGASLEARIADAWTRVLENPVDPGTPRSFFELGGQSLTAVKVVGLLAEEFGVTMRYIDFFRNATVAGLAAWIKDRSENV